jgi:hypothetical protein
MTPPLHSLAAARRGWAFSDKPVETAVATAAKTSQEHSHV